MYVHTYTYTYVCVSVCACACALCCLTLRVDCLCQIFSSFLLPLSLSLHLPPPPLSPHVQEQIDRLRDELRRTKLDGRQDQLHLESLELEAQLLRSQKKEMDRLVHAGLRQDCVCMACARCCLFVFCATHALCGDFSCKIIKFNYYSIT